MTPVAVTTYSDILRAIATRRKELGLTLEALDDVAGFTTNYACKLQCGMRNFGAMSFQATLGALRLEIAVEPDPEAIPPDVLATMPRLPPECFALERSAP